MYHICEKNSQITLIIFTYHEKKTFLRSHNAYNINKLYT